MDKENLSTEEINLLITELDKQLTGNLFEDVNYDLKKVRFEKIVKPIYFTQFPKDLDEIQSVRLKKDTFTSLYSTNLLSK